jgi:hypothetical protein
MLPAVLHSIGEASRGLNPFDELRGSSPFRSTRTRRAWRFRCGARFAHATRGSFRNIVNVMRLETLMPALERAGGQADSRAWQRRVSGTVCSLGSDVSWRCRRATDLDLSQERYARAAARRCTPGSVRDFNYSRKPAYTTNLHMTYEKRGSQPGESGHQGDRDRGFRGAGTHSTTHPWAPLLRSSYAPPHSSTRRNGFGPPAHPRGPALWLSTHSTPRLAARGGRPGRRGRADDVTLAPGRPLADHAGLHRRPGRATGAAAHGGKQWEGNGSAAQRAGKGRGRLPASSGWPDIALGPATVDAPCTLRYDAHERDAGLAICDRWVCALSHASAGRQHFCTERRFEAAAGGAGGHGAMFALSCTFRSRFSIHHEQGARGDNVAAPWLAGGRAPSVLLEQVYVGPHAGAPPSHQRRHDCPWPGTTSRVWVSGCGVGFGLVDTALGKLSCVSGTFQNGSLPRRHFIPAWCSCPAWARHAQHSTAACTKPLPLRPRNVATRRRLRVGAAAGLARAPPAMSRGK